MSISLGGLASGIDTTSLIDSLMSVARGPITQLSTRKAQVDSATQTISALSSRLAALKTASLALSTGTGFASFTASASDAAVVASATGAAGVGSYSVTVEALARAQKTRGQSVASSTTALEMTGTIELAFGSGDPVSVEVRPGDTLSDVASRISSSGARVSAAVMHDGTGYRLLLQGQDTGQDGAFTITENGLSLGLSDPGATYETAADAAFTVDGLAMTSKTNQVTGVLPGLKLALTKVTSEPVTVSVASDGAALRSKINSFISAYNDVVNLGHNAAGFGGTKASNLLLAADPAIRGALRRVGGLVSGAVPGTSAPYRTLANVGVKTNRDGTLTLDATKLEEALSADPAAVRRLFVTDPSSGATGLMSSMMAAVDGLISGSGAPIQARIDALSARSKRLLDTATKMEGRLEIYKTQLQKQFLNMDQLISKYQTMSSAIDASIISPSKSDK